MTNYQEKVIEILNKHSSGYKWEIVSPTCIVIRTTISSRDLFVLLGVLESIFGKTLIPILFDNARMSAGFILSEKCTWNMSYKRIYKHINNLNLLQLFKNIEQ